VWLISGIPIGIISAIKRRSLLDRSAMGIALVFVSAPVYWLGLLVLLPSPRTSAASDLFPARGRQLHRDHQQLRAVVPITADAMFVLASPRLRSTPDYSAAVSWSDGRGYIRTARAQRPAGESRRVQARRALAVTPLVTVLGLDIPPARGAC